MGGLEPELEVAEEAELSLNPSVADTQSTFGETRYERDFDVDRLHRSEAAGGASAFDDNDDEPKLKYDRLSSDLKDIFAHDSATAVAVNPKFIVVGTDWGRLHLLDALGHSLPQSQTSFGGRHAHSVAVSQISVDHSGEYVASCSPDGRVIISGLYSKENNHTMSTGKTIHSVALDPIFSRAGSGSRFMTGDDFRVILHEKTYFNRHKQVSEI